MPKTPDPPRDRSASSTQDNRSMTLDEFRSRKDTLGCKQCGRVGLDVKPQENAPGIQAICPHCGSGKPLGYVLYLKQKGPRTRRRLGRSGESVDEVWAEWGGQCLSCGLTKEEVELIGFDRERHHVPPLAETGSEEDTTLLPACTRCHATMTLNQALAKRQLAALRRRQVAGMVTDLVAGKRLPAAVGRDPEVRDAVAQTVDDFNRRLQAEATMMVAIDSNPLTYLVEAIEPGYDPAKDNSGLATERVAMVRCYFYGGIGFWVMPTVEVQYDRIQHPDRRLRHQRAARFLLHDAPLGAPEKSIADRVAELQAFHADAEDCRIVAEAEHAGVPALVTLDGNLIKHLSPHTRLALWRPSEFFASLGIEPGTEPWITPHPSNPLAPASWWRL